MKRTPSRSPPPFARFRASRRPYAKETGPQSPAPHSDRLALVSVFISVVALLATVYLSLESTKRQDQANEIQQRFADAERNAKIAALVTDLNTKTFSKLDFDAPKPALQEQVSKRSSETLLVLNSLFMVTRGTQDWDGYIISASERPLKTLENHHTRVRCQLLSDSFREFIFNEKWKRANECIVCSDVSCGN